MKNLDVVDVFLQEYFNKKVSYKATGDILLGRNYTFDLIDTPYVLKIFGDKDKWGREIASLEFLKNKNINAPQIYDCGLYKNNYWAIITRLPGVIFQEILPQLSCDEKKDLYYESGQLLGKLHTLTHTSIFGDWDETQQKKFDYSSFYDFETSKNRRRAYRTLELTERDINIFKNAIKEMLDLEYCLQNTNTFSLCHNDFIPRNILVQQINGEWHISGLIDFEAGYPSDSDSDLTKMLFENYNNENWRNFINGYSSLFPSWRDDEKKRRYYLISLCLEICSWAFNRCEDYYFKAENLLKNLLEA